MTWWFSRPPCFHINLLGAKCWFTWKAYQRGFFYATLGTLLQGYFTTHMGHLCAVSSSSMPWDIAEAAVGEFSTLRWTSTVRDEHVPCTLALQLFSSSLLVPRDNVHLHHNLQLGGTRCANVHIFLSSVFHYQSSVVEWAPLCTLHRLHTCTQINSSVPLYGMGTSTPVYSGRQTADGRSADKISLAVRGRAS